MVALVFAAGRGTRLKPWTDAHPKALVPVGGVPMLERVLRRIEALGPRRIVVNVHHFASQITDFLRHRQSKAEILVSDETGALLETGGGLLKATPLLDAATGEPILIHNADILTDVSLQDMIGRHTLRGAAATLLVSDRRTSRYFAVAADGAVKGWTNVSTGECRPSGLDVARYRLRAFDGIHVIDPSLLPLLKAYAQSIGKEAFSITPFYIDVCRNVNITAYEPQGTFDWYDVGDPDKLARAEAFIAHQNG